MLDKELIAELLGDGELDEEIIEIFTDFKEDASGRFKELRAKGNGEGVKRDVHQLKGVCANFGFSQTAGTLADLEQNLDTNFDDLLEKAAAEYERSVEAIVELYPDLK